MSTELQKQPAIPKSVKGWLSSDYFKTQVGLCLPKHLTADRFVRVALTALTRTPKLGDCTPESVIGCMMRCSELGIEPDGRRAHLIPFGKECTLIIDYKGLVELAKRSGDVSNIAANVVCENDQFEYNTGEITHKINFRQERGAMYAAYAIITFKDGGKHGEVMTKAEIDAIRKRSRASSSGPWVTDYNEMAKKTVFRRASKWVTLSPEIADALEKDADNVPSAAIVSETPLSFPEALPEPAPIDVAAQTEAAPVTEAPQTGPMGTSASQQSEELAKVVFGAGFTFSDFQKWAQETGNIPDADTIASFDDVNEVVAKRLLRAKVGLLKGLEAGRGAQ